jgi:phosphatidyl-myo-inositol dimannoside synthase
MSRIFLGAGTLEAGMGGIARVARMSARALIGEGHQLSVAALLDKTPHVQGAAKTMLCGGSKLRFAFACQIAGRGCDAFLYDHAGIARVHRSLPGTTRPYAIWMHGVEVWEALRPGPARMLKGASLVLVNSNYTLARYSALHGPLPQAKVCWLATEADDVGVRADAGAPPTVLILGRILDAERLKGHAELVAAWPKVLGAVPDARLVIAGAGPGLDELRSRVAASPASRAIEVLGFVPEAQIMALWQRTTVFAMPSFGEGFGLVYIEAMRHGIPVIASVYDAASEVNIHGSTGFNVGLEKPDDLSACLITLLANRDLAGRMGAAGQARWRANFCFSAFEARFVPIMTEFVNSSRPSKSGGA